MIHPGLKIKSIRERLEISRYALAKKSGVSLSFLNELERGKKEPTISTLSKLCAAIPISLSEFFSDESPQSDISPEVRELIDAVKELEPNQIKQITLMIKNLKG